MLLLIWESFFGEKRGWGRCGGGGGVGPELVRGYFIMDVWGVLLPSFRIMISIHQPPSHHNRISIPHQLEEIDGSDFQNVNVDFLRYVRMYQLEARRACVRSN